MNRSQRLVIVTGMTLVSSAIPALLSAQPLPPSPSAVPIASPPPPPGPSAVSRLEAFMITRALRDAGGNRTEAARRLGIHRQLLYAKVQKYGLDVNEPSADRTADVIKPDEPR